MPDASFLQTSFLGGEFSPYVQGRAEDPNYKRGMNLCRNGFPIEEGAAVRRPGTRYLAATRSGAFGVIRTFDFEQSRPYILELTAGHLRLLAGTSLILDTSTKQYIATISTANPCVLETETAHGLSTGDQVLAFLDPGDAVNATLAPLLGRELAVTVTDTTHFSVADAVTGATINGASIVLGNSNLFIERIFDFATPYLQTELQAVNTVQDQKTLLLLHGAHAPYALISTAAETLTTPAVFSLGTATFKDGPYMDPVTDGATITPGATSGSTTLTLAGGTTRWASTDVGRMVRIFSEPAAWAIGTSYNVGDQVKYNDEYFQALKANVGKQPDVDIINWGVATGAAVWTWATITAYTSATVVTATINGATLPRTTACATWRLGLYSATTGYPTCGVYHEGRLWLSGFLGNRVDASKSNDFFNFAPTASDGTVADDNAIAAVFNSSKVNKIFWMQSDESGIICGTQHGEWRIRSSAQNDPITPTSIQAKEVTTYGSSNIPAHRAGLPIVFVQKYGKKVLEYITSDYRGLTARNISITGKHLTGKGIEELAFQREKVPVIWARTTDGTLLGCTFKRESPWASDPPDFFGWHAHSLTNLTVTSLQSGPNYNGTLDAVSMVVQRSTDSKYYVVQMTDLFDTDWTIADSMFVDFGVTPAMYQTITTSNPPVLRFYGLHRLAGQTVDAFIGGVDFSGLVVGADGTLDVPYDNGGLLTSSWINGLSSTTNWHGLGLTIQKIAPDTVVQTPQFGGMLEFDTSLGGDGNGVSIPDWDAASGYGKPVLFTSSAASGACALWDLTATNTPPTRLAYHATNGGEFFQVGAVDSKGNFYKALLSTGGFGFKINKISPDLQTQNLYNFEPPQVNQPNEWLITQANGRDYLVSVGGQDVSVIDVTAVPPTYVGKVTITEPVAAKVSRQRLKGDTSVLWVLGTSASSGGSYTHPGQNMGLYRIVIHNATVSMVRVRDITPQMFGPTWTNFFSGADMLGDESDNNPIFWCGSAVLAAWSNATTYNQYDCVSYTDGHDYESKAGGNLNNVPAIGGTAFWRDLGVHQATAEINFTKVNAQTGAVMFYGKMTAGLNGYRNMSRVRYGKLRILDPSAHSSSNHWLWDIATLTNTGLLAATTDIWNVAPSGAKQFWNDKAGQWIANLGYGYLNGQPGSPVPVGATAASFNTWGELGPAVWTYPLVPAPNAATYWTLPAAIGYTYASQFQILRVIDPVQAGAQNGPALGKTRRTHKYSALFTSSQAVKFGVEFTNMHATIFKSPGNIPYAKTQLFTGVVVEEIEADYGYNNMICWEIDRPYPCNLMALEGFHHTQDR